MSTNDPTFIGFVASVTGGIVRVRLRGDTPATLIMVDGESYRVGQVGAFFRVPLGYTQLYAICTQVGADAAPQQFQAIAADYDKPEAHRWMTMVLFGESVGRAFERGVGQYPTVGDEVHLVTTNDLQVIYGSTADDSIAVGNIAAATGIPARLQVGPLLSRHSAIIGSTGSGKSNLVAVLLEALSAAEFSSARVLIIDPHGEYPTALSNHARVFRIDADEEKGEHHLVVPFWALPFDELREITLGGLQPNTEAIIRDMVLDKKKLAAAHLEVSPPEESLTADSPIPFSLNGLWFELDDFERRTFSVSGTAQNDQTLLPLDQQGNPEQLRPNRYPAASPYNQAPYKNQQERHIRRQLELMQSRLRDARFKFLFEPGGGYAPDQEGRVNADLDSLVSSWIGHNRSATILDVSGLPSEVLPTVIGTMLRVIYDALFWAADLPIGGRQQPLLVILEEAHRFLPEGGDTPAHRTLATIAKEGRKYGVGLMLVTQRPGEIDSTVLSQCGTMLALRVTNSSDRARVSSTFPDDLEGLTNLLPALRTGEALFVGDALPIPSRVRIRRATNKPVGDDPRLPEAWQNLRPDPSLYKRAVSAWRARSTSLPEPPPAEAEQGGPSDA